MIEINCENDAKVPVARGPKYKACLEGKPWEFLNMIEREKWIFSACVIKSIYLVRIWAEKE